MRFTMAWAKIATENAILKFSLLVSSFFSLVLCVALVKVSLKDPLIIERECFSKVIGSSQLSYSVKEVENFISLGLSKRFDSAGDNVEPFLSISEINFRKKEQEELVKRGIQQRLVIGSQPKIDKSKVFVDADRIISVGSVRSAIFFPLSITIKSVPRSALNPYGLIIDRVEPLKNEEDKKDEKQN